jgi:hypothetical protein
MIVNYSCRCVREAFCPLQNQTFTLAAQGLWSCGGPTQAEVASIGGAFMPCLEALLGVAYVVPQAR